MQLSVFFWVAECGCIVSRQSRGEASRANTRGLISDALIVGSSSCITSLRAFLHQRQMSEHPTPTNSVH
jgi:hypothetical protein